MKEGERPDDAWRGDDTLLCVAVFGLALAVRVAFLANLGVPPFDPWRHLALVRNLREGAGFTLFDGQPYLWYGPLWYRLCAAAPAWLGMEWIAGLLSALCAPLAYGWARRSCGVAGAVTAGVLVASAGPVVGYTCHYGPEAASLALVLGGCVAAAAGRGTPSAVASGLAFGIGLGLRMNFVFAAWLFLPWLRDRRRGVVWAAGALLPLALTWARNRAILRAHPWVFTWDGLATRSADFDLLSTLVVQMHPSVREGLRRLHEQIIPRPEWIFDPHGGIAWGLVAFVLCGVAGILTSRRLPLILAASTAFLYFLAFDRSLSSNFFRIYLVVFPAFFLGIALATDELWKRGRRALALALPLLALATGSRLLVPAPSLEIGKLTPPAELLSEPRYLVNSGFYHPESLIYRFEGIEFLGLPLDPAQLDEFLAAYPAYRTVLWHQDFEVQGGVREQLMRGGRVADVREARNPAGRLYQVLRLD